MLYPLQPTFYAESVLRLPLEHLREAHGISAYVFDLDNTLLPPHLEFDAYRQGQGNPIHTAFVDATLAWLSQLQAQGIPYMVVSNNKNRAYVAAAEALLGVPCVAYAAKPSTRTGEEVLAFLKCSPQQVAMVGDRPLTDIGYGQALGMKTILVDPQMRHYEPAYIRFLRTLERLLAAPASFPPFI